MRACIARSAADSLARLSSSRFGTMSISNVTYADPCSVAAKPPITMNSTPCSSNVRRIGSGRNSGSRCMPHRVPTLADELDRACELPDSLRRREPEVLLDDLPFVVHSRTEMDVQIEAAGADEIADGLKARCGGAAFEAGDHGLGGAGSFGELGLT